ncbi:hypothetical protein fugu_005522 [Takifugu bimaculatus]|uniref:Uncharacterized protein n=1 Tax=Takifugu bimaculatus TaxID=433685 RepID=A0A4Z2BBP3_9TELE|nr:hypothetical protein fugu_005522 [Takifugu bimaculatus]
MKPWTRLSITLPSRGEVRREKEKRHTPTERQRKRGKYRNSTSRRFQGFLPSVPRLKVPLRGARGSLKSDSSSSWPVVGAPQPNSAKAPQEHLPHPSPMPRCLPDITTPLLSS